MVAFRCRVLSELSVTRHDGSYEVRWYLHVLNTRSWRRLSWRTSASTLPLVGAATVVQADSGSLGDPRTLPISEESMSYFTLCDIVPVPLYQADEY